MKVLRNFTLHTQGPAEVRLAEEAGFQLLAAPEGVEVEGGLDAAANELAMQLGSCAMRDEAALVGGLTVLWIAALDRLALQGIQRPELAWFVTARERDANDRFMFNALRLELLPELSCVSS